MPRRRRRAPKRQDSAVDPIPLAPGPPATPWAFVSDASVECGRANEPETYYEWLRKTDQCKQLPLSSQLSSFFEPDSGRSRALSTELIDDLREIAYCPSRITCTCTPGTLIHPSSNAASARLLSDHPWPFDLHKEGTVQGWVGKRLLEYYWHHTWPSPVVEFPPAAGSAPAVERKVKSNVFGPLLHPSRTAVHQGLTLTLLRHAPPSTNRRPNQRNRWLRYMFRGSEPLPPLNQFPPLNSALGTMVFDGDFDEEAALALWGNFERCDVRLSAAKGWAESDYSPPAHLADDEHITLKGINGVTVAFLALVDWEHRKVFWSSWKTQGIVLADLMRHGAGWLLFRHPDPLHMPMSTQLFFQPLDLSDINEGAIIWTFIRNWFPIDPASRYPLPRHVVRERAMLLFRVWASRYSSSTSIEDSLPPHINILRDISPAWYETFDWRNEDEQRLFTMSCGWAFGVGAALVIETYARQAADAADGAAHKMKLQVSVFFRSLFRAA